MNECPWWTNVKEGIAIFWSIQIIGLPIPNNIFFLLAITPVLIVIGSAIGYTHHERMASPDIYMLLCDITIQKFLISSSI
jgi:hypothetical protein